MKLAEGAVTIASKYNETSQWNTSEQQTLGEISSGIGSVEQATSWFRDKAIARVCG